MNYYADVILPLPLHGTFTYHISKKQYKEFDIGHRVAVSFGKRKIYTGIIKNIHENKPKQYETKPIEFAYDKDAFITESQINFWVWMSKYYFTPIGDVLKAAVPSTFLLESETIIVKKEINQEIKDKMSDDEFLIYEALDSNSLKISEVPKIINKKNIYSSIQRMIIKDIIEFNFQINEKYSPKFLKVIYLERDFQNESNVKTILDILNKSPKQKEVYLKLLSNIKLNKYISISELKKNISFSESSIRGLEDKGLIRIEKVQVERDSENLKEEIVQNNLTNTQKKVAFDIINQLKEKNVVLLDGVTSSGKTEIYIKLIQDFIDKNEQVLYLLPEISLTTQIIQKLKRSFGQKISVFHSKYSINERTEVWKNIRQDKSKIVVGARSSIFLPFNNLGLIIVDEEHETSYKQQQPSPRYNARDVSIYLSKIYNSKIVLGSATPSIESRYNTLKNKYGYVQLKERYGDIELPLISSIDMRIENKHDVNSIFSVKLIDEIDKATKFGKQVILFRNRRGYSPQWSCSSCGQCVNCDNCDVSLTYHSSSNKLKCHYCGFSNNASLKCNYCGFNTMGFKGNGTQQVEESIKEIFPKLRTKRMDWDTTRGKKSFEKIINSFSEKKIDILIGTQMVTKGLDFNNVGIVGVLNTDHFLNFPDFRAHEKAFQILTQVAGRSGRSGERGKVFLQTYQPEHQIIKNVINYEYDKMFKSQLAERKDFKYPPYTKLIRVTLKDKSFDKINNSADWINNLVRSNFNGIVLGPVFPEVSRVKNKYQKQFLIKLRSLEELNLFRSKLQSILTSFESISKYRTVKIVIDVDPV
tara:strand:+ start:6335 stop:8773 length:2439 start_codon:yes stop_codon:yes gene_type:complete